MTRDKVIEQVKNYENYPNGLSKECRDYIIKALEQEPRKGYWIDTNNLDGEYKPIYMCSNCRSCYTEEMKPINMIFCPNCGCRMVEPQESEENNG